MYSLCKCGHTKISHVHYNSVNHKGETVPTYCYYPLDNGSYCECDKFQAANGICDYCGIRFDRPSIGGECEAKHATPDLAQKIVDAIENNLRGRRGMDWGNIDDEIQQEIRDEWAEIVRGHIASA